MDQLEEILRKYLDEGSDKIDVTMVLSLIKAIKKEQLCDDNFPHVCKVCGEGFGTTYSLYEHYVSEHN